MVSAGLGGGGDGGDLGAGVVVGSSGIACDDDDDDDGERRARGDLVWSWIGGGDEDMAEKSRDGKNVEN